MQSFAAAAAVAVVAAVGGELYRGVRLCPCHFDDGPKEVQCSVHIELAVVAAVGETFHPSTRNEEKQHFRSRHQVSGVLLHSGGRGMFGFVRIRCIWWRHHARTTRTLEYLVALVGPVLLTAALSRGVDLYTLCRISVRLLISQQCPFI